MPANASPITKAAAKNQTRSRIIAIMGVSIQCILERELPDIPRMEGKSLATAYCGEPGPSEADEGEAGDIIEVDFSGGSRPKETGSNGAANDSLLSDLTPFIARNGMEWHSPSDGLTVVRRILARLRDGATVAIDPEFPFADDFEYLTEGVLGDLEELEAILIAAERAGVRFCLTFDV
jgi:hypothetical protein